MIFGNLLLLYHILLTVRSGAITYFQSLKLITGHSSPGAILVRLKLCFSPFFQKNTAFLFAANSLISWLWVASKCFSSLAVMSARFSFLVTWRILFLRAIFRLSRFLRSSSIVFFRNFLWGMTDSWPL